MLVVSLPIQSGRSRKIPATLGIWLLYWITGPFASAQEAVTYVEVFPDITEYECQLANSMIFEDCVVFEILPKKTSDPKLNYYPHDTTVPKTGRKIGVRLIDAQELTPVTLVNKLDSSMAPPWKCGTKKHPCWKSTIKEQMRVYEKWNWIPKSELTNRQSGRKVYRLEWIPERELNERFVSEPFEILILRWGF